MNDLERAKLIKAIGELQDKTANYDRKSAIELIVKVRFEHPGKEQIAYVFNDTPLEIGTDEMIINTLIAEKNRLVLKLND